MDGTNENRVITGQSMITYHKEKVSLKEELIQGTKQQRLKLRQFVCQEINKHKTVWFYKGVNPKEVTMI